MKYMLMIWGNEEKWGSLGPDAFDDLVRRTDAHNEELRRTGEMVCAYGVLDQHLAKLVRVEAGVPVVSDGPYLETKEYLGSFTIVDVASEERALEIAAGNPASALGGVEVRPLMAEGAPTE